MLTRNEFRIRFLNGSGGLVIRIFCRCYFEIFIEVFVNLMTIGAIVQARMSSRRLPGKVLKPVAGKPMLQYLLERLEHCSLLDRVVVATSTEVSDDRIKLLCDRNRVECLRGSLEDVAGRFNAVIEKYKFDAFVRVNGDSPLLDQNLIDKGVTLFMSGKFDLVTNIAPRTFPQGQSVEVLRSETFRRTYRLMQTLEDREHVTRFFYRNGQDFKILNFVCEFDCDAVSLAIDTADDLHIFANVVSRMRKPPWNYSLPQLLELFRAATNQGKNYNS